MRTTFFAGAVLALVVSPATAETQSVAGQPVLRAPPQASGKAIRCGKTIEGKCGQAAARPDRQGSFDAGVAFGGSAGAFRRSGLR